MDVGCCSKSRSIVVLGQIGEGGITSNLVFVTWYNRPSLESLEIFFRRDSDWFRRNAQGSTITGMCCLGCLLFVTYLPENRKQRVIDSLIPYSRKVDNSWRNNRDCNVIISFLLCFPLLFVGLGLWVTYWLGPLRCFPWSVRDTIGLLCSPIPRSVVLDWARAFK